MPRRGSEGVTLIELMVGLAILAIVLALGTPNFSVFIQNGKIRNAADAMVNGLNLAKTEAVRRNTQVQFSLSGTDSSWQVGCATSSANCPDSIQSRPASEGSTGISVTATDSNLAFDGYARVATTLAAGANATFDIRNPAGGTGTAAGGAMRCLRVFVSSGGQIRMCDPALTLSKPSDPQPC